MGSCKACNCTEIRACPGGCAWVKQGLCSSCLSIQLEGLAELAGQWAETAGPDQEQGTLGKFPCAVIAGDGQIVVRDHLSVVVFQLDSDGAYLALQYEAAEVEAMFHALMDQKEAA